MYIGLTILSCYYQLLVVVFFLVFEFFIFLIFLSPFLFCIFVYYSVLNEVDLFLYRRSSKNRLYDLFLGFDHHSINCL